MGGAHHRNALIQYLVVFTNKDRCFEIEEFGIVERAGLERYAAAFDDESSDVLGQKTVGIARLGPIGDGAVNLDARNGAHNLGTPTVGDLIVESTEGIIISSEGADRNAA